MGNMLETEQVFLPWPWSQRPLVTPLWSQELGSTRQPWFSENCIQEFSGCYWASAGFYSCATDSTYLSLRTIIYFWLLQNPFPVTAYDLSVWASWKKAASPGKSKGQRWAALSCGRLTDAGWQVHHRRSLRYKRSEMKNDDFSSQKTCSSRLQVVYTHVRGWLSLLASSLISFAKPCSKNTLTETKLLLLGWLRPKGASISARVGREGCWRRASRFPQRHRETPHAHAHGWAGHRCPCCVERMILRDAALRVPNLNHWACSGKVRVSSSGSTPLPHACA